MKYLYMPISLIFCGVFSVSVLTQISHPDYKSLQTCLNPLIELSGTNKSKAYLREDKDYTKQMHYPCLGPFLSDKFFRVYLTYKRPSPEFVVIKIPQDSFVLLGGEFSELTDRKILDEMRVQYFECSFNAAVLEYPRVPRSSQEILDYVTTLMGICDFWEDKYQRRIIATPEDLWKNSDRKKYPRRKDINSQLRKNIYPPQITHISDMLYHGRFYMWHEIGGRLFEVNFLYWADGRIQTKSIMKANNLGPSDIDFLARM